MKEGGRGDVRSEGGMYVLVVGRHWCIVVQTEGFQEQDEVSEILVQGLSKLCMDSHASVGRLKGQSQ